jgi:copper(I)-binding protein
MSRPLRASARALTLAVAALSLSAGAAAAVASRGARATPPTGAAPAPVLLAQAHGHQHGHGHGRDAGAADGSATLGPIAVSGAFARAAAAPGGASAVYMTIATTGAPDRLVSAASPAAAKVELHTHTLDAQGVARMEAAPPVAVARDAPAELKPGGLHVMLMGLTAPLPDGATLPLTLTFENAGSVTVEVPVRAPGASGGHMHGG